MSRRLVWSERRAGNSNNDRYGVNHGGTYRPAGRVEQAEVWVAAFRPGKTQRTCRAPAGCRIAASPYGSKRTSACGPRGQVNVAPPVCTGSKATCDRPDVSTQPTATAKPTPEPRISRRAQVKTASVGPKRQRSRKRSHQGSARTGQRPVPRRYAKRSKNNRGLAPGGWLFTGARWRAAALTRIRCILFDEC